MMMCRKGVEGYRERETERCIEREREETEGKSREGERERER